MNLVFNGTIELLSPLAHNSDESLGTDTKYRRIGIIYDGKVIRVPVYSGNAFRGKLRRVAAKQFFDLLEFGKESMSDVLYYTCFTGGALKKGSSQDYIEIGTKRELREKMPFLSLFGTALQNQIPEGKLKIGIGVPISKETAHMTGIESTLSIWEMLDEIFYTRRDDLEDKEDGKPEEAHQMKYSIEVLIPGVVLKHKMSASNLTEVETACFGYMMQEFMMQSSLGGKSGTGHGNICFSYTPEFPDSKPYLDYIAENKSIITEYIQGIERKL